MISELRELFGEWIVAVDRAINSIVGRFVQQRQILLVEGDANSFTAKAAPVKKGAALPDVSFRLSNGRPIPSLPPDWEATLRGSRVEILLKPDHVLFRSLDFPKRAIEFLDGMIRAQIDRLTPWTANDAVFGWSPPSDLPNERIQLTLAATSKNKIQPLIQLAGNLGAASVTAFAEPPPGEAAPAKLRVFETSLQSAIGRRLDVPRLLRITLLCTGLAAKRKQTTPSSVMVLEAISRVLPDSTYVTELRIEGDKVQVVGISQDAPSLIRLIEQSPQFSRATFFAPTTRAQNDPGERFHIEVHITPYFGSGT